MNTLKWILGALLFICLASGGPSAAQQAAFDGETVSFAEFESELDQIREALHIPGLAAAVVQDQELVWAQGFGYANVEEGVPVTADTPFHLASVTKPIAATLLMQLVEEGALDLNEPAADFGVHFQDPEITVWHLLTHTSEGVPGTAHNYNGNRYSYLSRVIAGASGRSFGQLLTDRILVPLEMTHTAPNPSWFSASWEGYLATMGIQDGYQTFPAVYREMARPYQFDSDYNNIPGSYPLHFSPAAGLIASVTDLAKFDIALDNDVLLKPETKEQMFTPAQTNAGEALFYGLGWYTQQYNETRLVWHSGGWTPSVSALLMKVPDENLTFIALANNYNLTRPYPLGDGDVLYSTPALLFYKHFVFPQVTGKIVPSINWEAGSDQLIDELEQITDPQVMQLLERELWSYRKLYASVGETEIAERLLVVHRRVFPDFSSAYASGTVVGVNDSIPEPVPVSLLPEHVLVANWLLLGWLALTGLALLLLVVDFRRKPFLAWPYHLTWLILVLLFGWLGIGAYWLSDRPGKQAKRPSWRLTLGPAMFSTAGNMAGFVLVLQIIINFFPEAPGAPWAILGMFLVGWLIFRTPLTAWTTGINYWRMLPRTFLAALGSSLFIFIGAVPVAAYLMNVVLVQVENSPLFIFVVAAAAIAGAILVYPFTFWLFRRGSYAWDPYDKVVIEPAFRPRAKMA